MGALLRSLALFVAVSTLETTGDVEVPCGNVTTLHLQLSWARLHVPVSFGSFHSSDDLRSMIEDVAHKMCDKHRAEHELETPRCVREITDAAFTAIASSGAEAVGEPRVLLGVQWGDRVIPAVVPADPCESTAAAWGYAARVGLPLEHTQRVADDLDALRGAAYFRSPLLGAPDASLPAAMLPAATEVGLDLEANPDGDHDDVVQDEEQHHDVPLHLDWRRRCEHAPAPCRIIFVVAPGKRGLFLRGLPIPQSQGRFEPGKGSPRRR